ncbi:MAG: aminopeptidase P family protein [Pseudomonadales bacterium]
MNSVTARLSALRQQMRTDDVAACIITNFDPHHSEYSGRHWQAREYFSGFTGSAGDLVVLEHGGGLWTDGRYTIQAGEQLAGTDLELFMTRVEGAPTIAEHLATVLHSGATVAVAGNTINAAMYQELELAFGKANIELRTDLDLPGSLWQERPQRSTNQAFDYPLEFAGQSTTQKLETLRTALSAAGTDAIILSALPDVCWLLNIRGRDVPFCPLVEGFLHVSADSATFCVNQKKISEALANRLRNDGVKTTGYDDISELAQASTGTVSLCPQSTSSNIYRTVKAAATVRLEAAPTELLKAQKNPTEMAAFRTALRHDGVAMVRFARWLEQNVPKGNVTERSAEQVLRGFRAELPYFLDESFNTIAGYGAHAALMHYAASEDSDVTVGDDALFLVDSGGQYLGGTTDITRTFAFGEVNPQQRLDYTRVLQAVIRLTQTQFRKGARGCNLDIMARGILWQHGIDYECGTGHGVGQCLVVHEGPQNFSQRLVDAPLLPGMSITNEPGVYRAGRHGVRIENIMAVVEAQETEFGSFYGFETLTLAPIQTRALDIDKLSTSDKRWLNEYHQQVLTELGPLLDAEHQQWLTEACEPI